MHYNFWSRPALRLASILALFTILATSCSSVSSTGSSAPDNGDFVITWEVPEDEELAEVVEAVKEEEIVEIVIDAMNETIKLPVDVNIVFTNQDDGPAYFPDKKEIFMPYEFFFTAYELLEDSGWYEDDEALLVASIEANLFVLFHELGHALIDIYDLPMVAREEDAADSLAVVLSVELVGYGQMSIAAADLFGASGTAGNEDLAAYWDEHSLDTQRFYSIRCFLHGADPEQYPEALGDVEIDPERVEACPFEYQQVANGWQQLLAPYFNEDVIDPAESIEGERIPWRGKGWTPLRLAA